MKSGRGSLSRTLLVTVGGVLSVVILVLVGVAYGEVRRSALAGVADQLDRASREVAGALVSIAHGWRSSAQALAAAPATRSFLETRAAATRESAVTSLAATVRAEGLSGAALLDADGSVLAVAPAGAEVPPVSIPGEGEGDAPQIGRLTVVGDAVVVPIVAPVADDGGRHGLAVTWRRLDLDLRLSGARVFVGNEDGGPWTDLKSGESLPAAAVGHGEGLARYRRGGEGMLAASAAVPGLPWRVVTETPASQVLETPRRFLRRVTVLAALLCAIGLAATKVLARRIVAPLRDLTGAADAMSAGDYSIRVRRGPQGELGRLTAAFNSMVDQTQEALAQVAGQARQYRMLFEKNPNPMWVFERSSLRFLAVNEAAVRHYGYAREELLGMTIKDIRPPEEVPRLLQDVGEEHRGLDPAGTWVHRKKDGAEIVVEITSNEVTLDGRPGVLVLARDVTEIRRLEQRYRHAQRMQALGRLAGGVAHDFNNLLTVIIGEAELALERLAPDDPAAPALQEIGQAAARAASLTRQLLTFSRQQVVAPTVFDVNDLVASVEKMLHRLIGDDIRLVTRLHPAAGAITADRGQLEQVLVNLAVNARDAMPRGGLLAIETARAELDPSYVPDRVGRSAGDHLVISVSDSGEGMSEEVRSQAFEPFFTTKPVGKATGLGLATCYGIVRQAGGHIELYSEPGTGTTVKIYLPSTDEVPEPPAPVRVSPRSRGGERIFVVEDQDAVREVTTRMLRSLGYTVTSAPNGEEALARLASPSEPVDLLLTDVVLPGMNGGELAERAQRVRPGLKVIFASGYTGDVPAYHNLLREGVPFLQKPFTRETLGRRAREVLDGS